MFDFLSQKFSSIFSYGENATKMTEANIQQTLQQVEEALLEADVPYQVTQDFIGTVRAEVVGSQVVGSLKPHEQLIKVIRDKIIAFLGNQAGIFSFQYPSVVMVMGLQGSGKTTTIGKLAYKIKKDAEKDKKNIKILVASVDFYRPAALDQLDILAKKVGVDSFRSMSSDVFAATKEIYNYYKQGAYDILLFDTAGRLHVDNMMLQELQDIDAAIQPNIKLLVLDSMTGQESLAVARVFNDTVGFNGAVLTKMDSDTRGGSAFAFRYVLKKPIFFVGEGESFTDLNVFYPERAAERMLGMGDLATLMEQVDEKIVVDEQKKVENAFKAGSFTLQDFADQMSMMSKIGSLSQVIKYMPGMGSISPEMVQKGEKELVRFRAIISSMTPKERLNIRILNNSRYARIASGAGVKQEDVHLLIKRFEEAQQYVKLLNKFGSF